MNPLANLNDIKPADLPAPPQAALEVLRACSSDKVDNRTLSNFAEMDPVLTAEILRVVNSPLFGIGKEVNSVRTATALLGAHTLRNIVLCLMVREAAQSFVIKGFDISSFWEDSVRRGVAARQLAELVSVNPDDAFTCGVLQDFGLLVLYYLNPDATESFEQLRGLTPLARYTREEQVFQVTHEQIIGLLADSWALPGELVNAIVTHHDKGELSPLAHISNCTDWICSLFNSQDVNRVLKNTINLAERNLKINEQDLRKVLATLPQQVESSARAMGLSINEQIDFEQLLRQANSLLAKENLSYQELNWQLEKALQERDHLAQELEQEIAIAQEVQRRFMPEPDSHIPVHAMNLPARCISGDFYDFIKLTDGRVWFALGDVSGKGINAGLLMSKTASLFRCLARRMDNPQKLMQILNSEIYETATRGFFVSMVIGLYTPKDQTARIVNAGHLPVLIDHDDKGITRLEAVAQPLGILPDTYYPASDPISLHNSTLYLYSDGVTEAPDPAGVDGQMLEEQGLIKLIEQYRGLSAGQRVQAIVNVLTGTNANTQTSLHDDITLLLLEPV